MMNYKERINSISNLTMNAIIDNCKAHIPTQFRHRPYWHPELNHGLDLLRSDEGLDCYIGAYGEMHQSKCRAALQNMPFPPKENSSSLSLEIVDWGCGQGIGSVCVIDFLKERNLTQWLKKVTLIEPSEASLNRAVANVTGATNNRVRVIPINEYLPSVTDGNEISSVTYEQNFVIHIFSNILDVTNIDLGKLAKCMAIPGHTHYILCMGPLNANAFRIDRFSEIFQASDYFSDIANSNYGRTTDTNYCFTCKTKGFVYYGTSLDLSKYNPQEKAKTPVYGEYDVNLQISNKLFSLEKGWVYYRLQNILSPTDLIYLNPDLNGTSPDFVIIRPNVGIIVISVFEEDLTKCQVNIDDHWLIDIEDNDGKIRTIQSPYTALENSQNLIIENIREITEAVIDDSRNLSLVKKVLVCTKGTKEQATELFGKQQWIEVYGSDFLNIANDPANKVATHFFDDLRFHYRSSIFDSVVLQQLKHDLSPKWHSYREGIDFNLSTPQRNLSKSVAGGQRKISGVAGSGKTQVLAKRAVNAQVRSGGNILILTFNISLVNYMKMRLSQVRADFPWDKIHIDYYHRFFRKHANARNLHVYFNSYDDENFFNGVTPELPKYDAILIDEVQDYKTSWLQLIRRNFLKDNGEFVVFGDPKQNIYHRKTSENGDILLGVIPGEWNKTLTKGHRFSNPALTNLAMRFQKQFIGNPDEIEVSNNMDSGIQFNLMQYHNIPDVGDTISLTETICSICFDFIKNNDINVSDVAIIAPQTNLLREIDYKYRQATDKKTTITFVSKEGLQRISRRKSQASYGYKQDLERLEKVLKNRFTMVTRNLKMSTIQSFKGWEAPTIICIIQNDIYSDENVVTSPELVYTGITRAKENLLVINIGNNQYHNFFTSHLQSI
ncbi:MAG: UvrD-helicase domain-containing protein [Bacteroidales bacterium]|nr:UvrD-helicase domain-containing protein [Bacteroidales bacterium]